MKQNFLEETGTSSVVYEMAECILSKAVPRYLLNKVLNLKAAEQLVSYPHAFL